MISSSDTDKTNDTETNEDISIDLERQSSKTPVHLREQVDLPQDTYTLLFLSNDLLVTVLTIYVFFFKVSLYGLLLAEDLGKETDNYHKGLVTTAQSLLLPIAVLMQQDLTSTLGLVANVKYNKDIMNDFPGATYKRYVASVLRLGFPNPTVPATLFP